jgi:hypothetical protein
LCLESHPLSTGTAVRHLFHEGPKKTRMAVLDARGFNFELDNPMSLALEFRPVDFGEDDLGHGSAGEGDEMLQ